MKNISLQSLSVPSINSPVKNTAELASKSDASGVDSESAISPFQLALSKQVGTRSAQAKQGSSKPTQETGPALAKQATSNQVATDAGNIVANLQRQMKTSFDGSAEEIEGTMQVTLDEKIKPVSDLLNKDLMFKAEFSTAEDTSAEDIAGLERSSEFDPSSVVLPEINTVFVVPPVTSPMQPASEVKADAQLSSITSGILQKQVSLEALSRGVFPIESADNVPVNQSYDAALTKALSSNKSVSVSENDAGNIQSTQNNLNQNDASEHTQWLDAVLSGVGKQSAAGNESGVVASKLESNAIKGTIESGLKEVAQPISFQAALQTNVAAPIQPVGSTNSIASYPGNAGWDQAISQKIVWMVGAGEQSATLTLNPPDLGPLQVVIHVHNDQADATFISDNAEVRQALENGMSNLRDKMSDAGIQLGQANVNAGSQSQQEFQRAMQNRLASRVNDASGLAPTLDVDGAKTQGRNINGLVDTFA